MKTVHIPTTKHLRVFYGWSRINNIRKREAISVIFENDRQPEERTMRLINKMIDVVYVRDQTEGEKKDAEGSIRMFTEYSVFLDEKQFNGSLELALRYNSESDRNNVSADERELIKQKLKEHYLSTHLEYKESAVQLEIEF
ncbi:MAG: hypothetical protein K2J29_00780 [Muribaculaceae bacterium]|nr:hypothetical protein [Muribaculaceae bacterium]